MGGDVKTTTNNESGNTGYEHTTEATINESLDEFYKLVQKGEIELKGLKDVIEDSNGDGKINKQDLDDTPEKERFETELCNTKNKINIVTKLVQEFQEREIKKSLSEKINLAVTASENAQSGLDSANKTIEPDPTTNTTETIVSSTRGGNIELSQYIGTEKIPLLDKINDSQSKLKTFLVDKTKTYENEVIMLSSIENEALQFINKEQDESRTLKNELNEANWLVDDFLTDSEKKEFKKPDSPHIQSKFELYIQELSQNNLEAREKRTEIDKNYTELSFIEKEYSFESVKVVQEKDSLDEGILKTNSQIETTSKQEEKVKSSIESINNNSTTLSEGKDSIENEIREANKLLSSNGQNKKIQQHINILKSKLVEIESQIQALKRSKKQHESDLHKLNNEKSQLQKLLQNDKNNYKKLANRLKSLESRFVIETTKILGVIKSNRKQLEKQRKNQSQKYNEALRYTNIVTSSLQQYEKKVQRREEELISQQNINYYSFGQVANAVSKNRAQSKVGLEGEYLPGKRADNVLQSSLGGKSSKLNQILEQTYEDDLELSEVYTPNDQRSFDSSIQKISSTLAEYNSSVIPLHIKNHLQSEMLVLKKYAHSLGIKDSNKYTVDTVGNLLINIKKEQDSQENSKSFIESKIDNFQGKYLDTFEEKISALKERINGSEYRSFEGYSLLQKKYYILNANFKALQNSHSITKSQVSNFAKELAYFTGKDSLASIINNSEKTFKSFWKGEIKKPHFAEKGILHVLDKVNTLTVIGNNSIKNNLNKLGGQKLGNQWEKTFYDSFKISHGNKLLSGKEIKDQWKNSFGQTYKYVTGRDFSTMHPFGGKSYIDQANELPKDQIDPFSSNIKQKILDDGILSDNEHHIIQVNFISLQNQKKSLTSEQLKLTHKYREILKDFEELVYSDYKGSIYEKTQGILSQKKLGENDFSELQILIEEIKGISQSIKRLNSDTTQAEVAIKNSPDFFSSSAKTLLAEKKIYLLKNILNGNRESPYKKGAILKDKAINELVYSEFNLVSGKNSSKNFTALLDSSNKGVQSRVLKIKAIIGNKHILSEEDRANIKALLGYLVKELSLSNDDIPSKINGFSLETFFAQANKNHQDLSNTEIDYSLFESSNQHDFKSIDNSKKSRILSDSKAIILQYFKTHKDNDEELKQKEIYNHIISNLKSAHGTSHNFYIETLYNLAYQIQSNKGIIKSFFSGKSIEDLEKDNTEFVNNEKEILLKKGIIVYEVGERSYTYAKDIFENKIKNGELLNNTKSLQVLRSYINNYSTLNIEAGSLEESLETSFGEMNITSFKNLKSLLHNLEYSSDFQKVDAEILDGMKLITSINIEKAKEKDILDKALTNFLIGGRLDVEALLQISDTDFLLDAIFSDSNNGNKEKININRKKIVHELRQFCEKHPSNTDAQKLLNKIKNDPNIPNESLRQTVETFSALKALDQNTESFVLEHIKKDGKKLDIEGQKEFLSKLSEGINTQTGDIVLFDLLNQSNFSIDNGKQEMLKTIAVQHYFGNGMINDLLAKISTENAQSISSRIEALNKLKDSAGDHDQKQQIENSIADLKETLTSLAEESNQAQKKSVKTKTNASKVRVSGDDQINQSEKGEENYAATVEIKAQLSSIDKQESKKLAKVVKDGEKIKQVIEAGNSDEIKNILNQQSEKLSNSLKIGNAQLTTSVLTLSKQLGNTSPEVQKLQSALPDMLERASKAPGEKGELINAIREYKKVLETSSNSEEEKTLLHRINKYDLEHDSLPIKADTFKELKSAENFNNGERSSFSVSGVLYIGSKTPEGDYAFLDTGGNLVLLQQGGEGDGESIKLTNEEAEAIKKSPDDGLKGLVFFRKTLQTMNLDGLFSIRGVIFDAFRKIPGSDFALGEEGYMSERDMSYLITGIARSIGINVPKDKGKISHISPTIIRYNKSSIGGGVESVGLNGDSLIGNRFREKFYPRGSSLAYIDPTKLADAIGEK